MFSRRTFLSLAAGSIAAPRLASAQQTLAEGRALCKCRGRSHALRRGCRGRGVDQARDRHAARGRAICLAACIETLSVCCVQQQRFRLRQSGDGASRHRVPHRPRDWRAQPARRADTAADAPDPHQHGHSVGEHSGGVQQSERGARLPHQQGLHAGRRGDPARPDRRRHLRPPGARDTQQSAGDPGDPRQRRHRRPRRKIRVR